MKSQNYEKVTIDNRKFFIVKNEKKNRQPVKLLF